VRKRILALLSALLLALAGSVLFAPSAAADGKGKGGHGHHGFSHCFKRSSLPDVISLPDGFRPEGISTWGRFFFVGSVATGRIWRGNVVTGEGVELVAPVGTPAIGTEVDWRGRLWVAGGPSGLAKVYNARTGALVKSVQLTAASPDGTTTFINDVVVTRDAAYFTDSRKDQLFKVAISRNGAIADTATALPLSGDYTAVHVPGSFNLNGIEATRGGRVLFGVHSGSGSLFTIDPTSGAAKKVTTAALPGGDGLLLLRRSLYVVSRPPAPVTQPPTPPAQTPPAEVVQLRLSRDLTSATVVERITDTDFSVPATVAAACGSLYVANARFGVANPDTAAYRVVRVHK
jgi:hypothetical protein